MTAIRVELQLSDGSFTSGMLRAGQSVEQFRNELARTDPHFRALTASGNGYITSANRINTTNRSMLGRFRDVALVAGGLALVFSSLTGASNGFIGQIVRVNADMERLRYQMQSMSQTQDPFGEATRSVQYLRDMIREVPFSLREISTSFVKLQASGLDPMAGSLQSLTDGIAAFGGTDEQLHRITLGVTQMMGKSVIQMEEMRQQLGESMPNAMRMMARSMGVSVAEMTAAIATGTVQARPALESFFEEIDRSFGGAAQRMMQTFSGQVTQMNANLQVLATDSALSDFVNVTLKDLVREFNSFLRSDEAKRFADSLGEALRDITNRVATVVRGIYYFREEIKLIGIALAAAFGGGLVIRGLQALVVGVTSTKLAFSAMTGSLSLVRTQIGLVGTTASATAVRLGALGAALRVVGATAAFAGAAFSIWLPVIIVLGGAILLAARHMGFFRDSTREAYDELKEFGALSREEAQEISEDREAALRAELADAQTMQRRSSFQSGTSQNHRYATRRIGELDAEIAAILAERENLVSRSGERQDQAERERIDNQLADLSVDVQTRYRLESQALDDWLVTEQSMLEESGRSRREIDEEYETERRRLMVALAEDELDLIRQMIVDRTALHLTLAGQPLAIAANNDSLEHLGDLRDGLVQTLAAAEAWSSGINLGPATEDIEDLVVRGVRALDELNDKFGDLEVNVRGGSTAYERLMRQIQRGDFGTIAEGGERVAELHANILAAARAVEMLDGLMETRDDATRDSERLRQDAIDRRMQAEETAAGVQLTDAERMIRRINEGYYVGLGPISLIRQSLNDVIGRLDIQGSTLNRVATAMQDHAFGEASLNAISTVQGAIDTLTGSLGGMSGALGGINFSGFGGVTGSRVANTFNGSMLDLIGQAEGTDQGRGYNETLDYGRWTGGDKDLINMTLEQILELQRTMLQNPENRAMYGEGRGSSALGRYQIVSLTLRDLMEEMGLTGEELFSVDMQDQMATRLLARRQGQGNVGLRNEWEGLNRVSDTQIARAQLGPTVENANASAAYDASITQAALDQIAASQSEFTTALLAELGEVTAITREAMDLEETAALEAAILSLQQQIMDATGTVQTGQAEQTLMDAIRGGDFGRNVDETSSAYAGILEIARNLDTVEKTREDRLAAQTDSERGLVSIAETRIQLQRDLENERQRSLDPNYVAESSGLRQLVDDMDDYIGSVRDAYGEGSAQLAQALELRSSALAEHRQLDALVQQNSMNDELLNLEQRNMSQRQQQDAEMNRRLATVDQIAASMRAAGQQEVEITRYVEEQKARIRAAYATQNTAVTDQFEEWGNIWNTLDTKMASWWDSAATGIAGLLTGTSDMRSVVNGMINDVANMAVRNMFSKVGGGMAGGGKGGGKGGAKGAGSIMKTLVGVAHTGGIIGSSSLSKRSVSPGLFSNAPKFHTGGIIDKSLKRGEKPIIAMTGEGVFTREQMAALAPTGSMGGIQISAPITVTGSGGSPEQNTDLARKISTEMERNMRGVVISELQRQMRPGNMLGSRG